jgi:type VI secretion system secreted protein Hcp
MGRKTQALDFIARDTPAKTCYALAMREEGGSAMPLTAYLKIPDIPGESQRAGHEDEIDIHDIQWGIERMGSVTVAHGRRRTRTEMSPLRVRKYYDASSPYLALAVETGQVFDEVVVSVRKDSGDAHLDYLIITMVNVIVSSYGFSTEHENDPGGRLTEAVAFEFEHVTLAYTRQADDGSAGDTHEVTLPV